MATVQLSSEAVSAFEEWRCIEGAPEGYEVSSLGRVKTPVVGIRPGRMGNHGYRVVEFSTPGTGRIRRLVHREVCRAFNGPQPFAGAIVRHLDGDRLNNLPENLEWGTKRQNTQDAIAHGTLARGERCGQARLTEAQVLMARERLARGEMCKTIAADYGVDPATISAMKRGRSWAWL